MSEFKLEDNIIITYDSKKLELVRNISYVCCREEHYVKKILCECEFDTNDKYDFCLCYDIDFSMIEKNISDYVFVLYSNNYLAYHNKCLKEYELSYINDMYFKNDMLFHCNFCRNEVLEHMYDGDDTDLCMKCYEMYKNYLNNDIIIN